MSREVISAAIRGATEFVNEAEAKLGQAIKDRGEDHAVAFPGTAFQLPMISALMGLEVTKLGQLKEVMAHCRELLATEPTSKLWLPYLGDGLDAGVAALLAMETTCAIRYVDDESIEEGFTGFISDTILRELGIQLVDGRMPGFAAILGPAPSEEIAVHTVRELQKRLPQGRHLEHPVEARLRCDGDLDRQVRHNRHLVGRHPDRMHHARQPPDHTVVALHQVQNGNPVPQRVLKKQL